MRIAIVLRRYRAITEKTTRELAAEIGIGASTYSRIERGEGMDGETLATILKWLLSEEKPA